MKCKECGVQFTPHKFKPGQKYCSAPCRESARRRYKRAYDRDWRRRNPEYMKEFSAAYRELS